MDPLQLLHCAKAVGDPNPTKRRWLDDALDPHRHSKGAKEKKI